jgi:DNA-binding transcriptional regulator YhcF (GntR family)
MSQTYHDRLAIKTPEQRFLFELQTDFELSPVEAREILETARRTLAARLDGDPAGALKAGQIRQVLAALKAPYGRPLTETDLVEVVWTLDAGLEDGEVRRRQGKDGLRQVRILRLIDEALDQGGVPSIEDLAQALGVTPRTVKRDLAELQARGFLIKTRGKLKGAGRGQSHKVLIVGLYLDRYTYTEIEQRTRHTIAAIKRYLVTFGQVVLLHRHDLPAKEIAFLAGISERLVEEYLALYHRRTSPEDRARIQEILDRVSGANVPRGGEAEKGGRGP